MLGVMEMNRKVLEALAIEIYEMIVDNAITIDKVEMLPTYVSIKVHGYKNVSVNIEKSLIRKYSNTDDLELKKVKTGTGFYWIMEV
jgi:hypothetical protein